MVVSVFSLASMISPRSQSQTSLAGLTRANIRANTTMEKKFLPRLQVATDPQATKVDKFSQFLSLVFCRVVEVWSNLLSGNWTYKPSGRLTTNRINDKKSITTKTRSYAKMATARAIYSGLNRLFVPALTTLSPSASIRSPRYVVPSFS